MNEMDDMMGIEYQMQQEQGEIMDVDDFNFEAEFENVPTVKQVDNSVKTDSITVRSSTPNVQKRLFEDSLSEINLRLPRQHNIQNVLNDLQSNRFQYFNSQKKYKEYQNPNSKVDLSPADQLTVKISYIKKAIKSSKFLHIGVPVVTTEDLFCCTLTNGHRYFLNTAHDHPITIDRDHSTSLLSKPIDELMKECDKIRIDRLVSTQEAAPSSSFDQLWVDKYSPSTFSQLLSSERINREVLRALKQWDDYVFKSKPNQGVQSTASLKEEKVSDSNKKPFLKVDTRPKKKVLLLCGPPGTGKTTLAHIVARHCGYHPIEINASDDRSPEKLKEKIYFATQSQTISSHHRPNCLILDEIDGIDTHRNSLDTIINIITAPLYGPSSSTFPLTRPMICICNDAYTPSLREIKKHCEIFTFTPPTEARLIERLKMIGISEHVSIPSKSLTLYRQLCVATGCDIRSAINTLQFSFIKMVQDSSKPSPSKLNESDANATTLQGMMEDGLKDDHVDIFQVWRSLFGCVKSLTTSQMAMDSMHAYGDYNQIMIGIFENIQNFCEDVELGQTPLAKRAVLAEWISYTDVLNQFSYDCPDGQMVEPYLCSVAGAIHWHCHEYGRQYHHPINWPTKDRNVYYLHQQRENIVRTFCQLSLLSCPALRLSSSKVILLDVLTSLIDIINPPHIRSLPILTLSTIEQQQIQEVVSIMDSVGLRYGFSKRSPEENPPNQTGYSAMEESILALEPALDQLIHMSSTIPTATTIATTASSGRIGMQSHVQHGMSSRTGLSQSMKKLMFVEQRKFQIYKKASKIDTAVSSNAVPVGEEVVIMKLDMEKENKDNQFIFGKEIKKSSKDYFKVFDKRKAEGMGAMGKDMEMKNNAKRNKIQFKFNQGYSNAVKRMVIMKEFC